MTDENKAEGPEPRPNDAGREGSGDAPKPPLDGKLRVAAPADGPFATQLAETTRCYARGDFGGARARCRAVLAGASTPAEQEFARMILERTSIDPVALLSGLGAFALFWLVLYLTLWR